MQTKVMKSATRLTAESSLIDWATAGLPSTLADSVGATLMTIARAGTPREDDKEWVLFGEVVGTCDGPPFTAHLHRLPLLVPDQERTDGTWDNWDLVCPIAHTRVDFNVGMQIGVLSKPSDHQVFGKIMAGESVPVWNLSSFDKDLSWNVSHLFSGAYEGWLRAMWWLQQANLGHSFATHTSVDWCPMVMKTWSFNHGREHLQAPVQASYSSKEVFNAILADIGDASVLRATSNKSNLMMTLSPPCPSWSKGGKHSGLATDEGYCFLDAIEHVSRVQPVLALFECSDGLEAHPHWRVISAAMQLAGSSLAIIVRDGWQFGLGRIFQSTERFLCIMNRRLNWNDQKHLHALPSALAEGLLLQPPQELVYGDRTLLPPAKRTRVDNGATTQQVLEQRVVQHGDYLPTLCASYTAQHLLQRERLEAKGIFATLVQRCDRYSFIGPFVFVSLFGTTDSIALPQVHFISSVMQFLGFMP